MLGGGDAAGASSASAGQSKGAVVQGGSGLDDAQRRKLAQAAAARAGKSNGKLGGTSQQHRRGQRADSSDVEVVEGSHQGQEEVEYNLDDDDLEMKGYLPPHLFKKHLETKYGPAAPRHSSASPVPSTSGAHIKSNTKIKGASSNRARARALFNLTPDPESSAGSEEDLPGPSTIGRRLQVSKSARQASQTPTLDVDRSADGDETITSTEDEGASKARKSKAKKTSKGKAADKGQSGTSVSGLWIRADVIAPRTPC